MAILTSGTQGEIRGHSGDNVYRVDNGKIIVSPYVRHIKTTSPRAQTNRRNFGGCSVLCYAMLRSEVLNYIWKNSPFRGNTAANKAVSVNSRFVKSLADIDNIVLVPAESYFDVQLLGVSSNPNTLTINVSPVASKTWMGKWRVSAQGLYYWLNTTPEGNVEKVLESTVSDTKVIVPDEPMSFDLTILDSDKYPFYPEKKFVVSLIIYNMAGKPVEASNNLIGNF
jgi:hypothetical protein